MPIFLFLRRGFTLMEVIIALGVFSIIIVGSTSLFQYFSAGIAEMQQSVQAEVLAQNTLDITESIIKNSSDWKNHLQGSPLQGSFFLRFNGTQYLLSPSSGSATDSGVSIFSLTPSSNETQFYKKLSITEVGNNIYQIESDICFQACTYHTKLYRLSSIE